MPIASTDPPEPGRSSGRVWPCPSLPLHRRGRPVRRVGLLGSQPGEGRRQPGAIPAGTEFGMLPLLKTGASSNLLVVSLVRVHDQH